MDAASADPKIILTSIRNTSRYRGICRRGAICLFFSLTPGRNYERALGPGPSCFSCDYGVRFVLHGLLALEWLHGSQTMFCHPVRPAHNDRDLLVANRQSCTLPMHVDNLSCFDLERMDAKAYCWHVVVFESLRILAGLRYIAATTQPIRSRESTPRIPLHSIAEVNSPPAA